MVPTAFINKALRTVDPTPEEASFNLPQAHIEVGNFIWYRSVTSRGDWNCPAEITKVNNENQTFNVRSLDDMVEQFQTYSFDPAAGSMPVSRLTMHAITMEEASAYVKEQRKKLTGKSLTAYDAHATRLGLL